MHGSRPRRGIILRASRRPALAVTTRTAAFVVVASLGVFDALFRIGRATRITDEITYVNAGWDYVHGVVTANLEHPPTAKYLFGRSAGGRPGRHGSADGGRARRTRDRTRAVPVPPSPARVLGWPHRRRALVADTARQRADLVRRGERDARADRPARVARPRDDGFAVVAVAAAWQWTVAASDGRSSRWWWAALAGAALALSATSKVSTAVLVLPLLLLPVLFRRWRDLALGGALAAGSRSSSPPCSTCRSADSTRSPTWCVSRRARHDRAPGVGARTDVPRRAVVDGLLWALQGLGWPTVVVLGAGTLAASWSGRTGSSRTSRSVSGPRGVLLHVERRTAALLLRWVPFVVALAAVGFTRLARLRPPWTAVVAALVLAVAVVPGGQLTTAVAEVRPTGYAVLGGALADHGTGAGPSCSSAPPGRRTARRSGPRGGCRAPTGGSSRSSRTPIPASR